MQQWPGAYNTGLGETPSNLACAQGRGSLAFYLEPASNHPNQMDKPDEKPNKTTGLSFWVMWAILKSTGIRNLRFSNMRRLSKSEKSEMIRMWRAPKLEDDDIF